MKKRDRIHYLWTLVEDFLLFVCSQGKFVINWVIKSKQYSRKKTYRQCFLFFKPWRQLSRCRANSYICTAYGFFYHELNGLFRSIIQQTQESRMEKKLHFIINKYQDPRSIMWPSIYEQQMSIVASTLSWVSYIGFDTTLNNPQSTLCSDSSHIQMRMATWNVHIHIPR